MAEIWAYLAAEASEMIATRFLKAIEERFAPLLHSPLLGSPREQFAPGLRVTFAYALRNLLPARRARADHCPRPTRGS
jgi:plasmid stabilization system protein ParE